VLVCWFAGAVGAPIAVVSWTREALVCVFVTLSLFLGGQSPASKIGKVRSDREQLNFDLEGRKFVRILHTRRKRFNPFPIDVGSEQEK
jgi:hypothetical protein